MSLFELTRELTPSLREPTPTDMFTQAHAGAYAKLTRILRRQHFAKASADLSLELTRKLTRELTQTLRQ